MQSVLESAAVAPSDAPTMTEGTEAWAALSKALDERAKLDAQIVRLTRRVQRSGTIERIEGVTLDTALSRTHRLPRADRSMILTSADVLADMPATERLFNSQLLSWGEVRGIVAEARRLTKDQRRLLDAYIAASPDLLAKMDPDDALDAVMIAAAETRDERCVERAERDVVKANFLWAQPGMLDRGKVYGELDNCSLAALITGIDAAAPPDDGRPVSQRRADGIVTLATHRCPDETDDLHTETTENDVTGGADSVQPDPVERMPERSRGHIRRPRVTADIVVLVDTRDASAGAAGQLLINIPGCIPTVSAALLESLATDASVRAVLMDGGRPLTVGKKVWARELPKDVRLAVKARDRADRFPGSRRPIEHVHHANKQGEGHHIDHLVGLSEPSHRRVHRFGWSVALDPPTGEVTFTRGERSWTTLPRGTRLRRPPPA